MVTPTESLGTKLREAISQGRFVDVIRLLQELPASAVRSAGRTDASSSDGFSVPTWSSGGLPPDVLSALQHGRKIEAIRLLRKQTGMDLRSSKQAVEAHLQQSGSVQTGLSPGEVPRSRTTVWWLIAVLLFAGYLLRELF